MSPAWSANPAIVSAPSASAGMRAITSTFQRARAPIAISTSAKGTLKSEKRW